LETVRGRDHLAALAKDELQQWLNRWRWLEGVGILEAALKVISRHVKD
jgi:hypothetical protein